MSREDLERKIARLHPDRQGEFDKQVRTVAVLTLIRFGLVLVALALAVAAMLNMADHVETGLLMFSIAALSLAQASKASARNAADRARGLLNGHTA